MALGLAACLLAACAGGEAPIRPGRRAEPPRPEPVAPAITVGALEVDPPTFHCLGLSLSVEGDDNYNATAAVSYREPGGAWREAKIERYERTLSANETLALCTDGWLEAGPVASHQGPESFAEMTQSLSGLELEELTERLRADAVGRSSGSLRDDLVVLAVRPRETSKVAEAPRKLTTGAG